MRFPKARIEFEDCDRRNGPEPCVLWLTADAQAVTRFRPLSAPSLSVDEASTTRTRRLQHQEHAIQAHFGADQTTLRPSGVQRLTTEPNKSFSVWRLWCALHDSIRCPRSQVEAIGDLHSCGRDQLDEVGEVRLINDSITGSSSEARREVT